MAGKQLCVPLLHPPEVDVLQPEQRTEPDSIPSTQGRSMQAALQAQCGASLQPGDTAAVSSKPNDLPAACSVLDASCHAGSPSHPDIAQPLWPCPGKSQVAMTAQFALQQREQLAALSADGHLASWVLCKAIAMHCTELAQHTWQACCTAIVFLTRHCAVLWRAAVLCCVLPRCAGSLSCTLSTPCTGVRVCATWAVFGAAAAVGAGL